MPPSPFAAPQPAFAIEGVGLSTYAQGGYADSSVANLIGGAALDGANYVEFSNIVLADLTTGTISDAVENGVDQTASLADVGRAIDLAEAAGLQVMLKPQIAVHDPAYAGQYSGASWINMVDPNLTIANPATFFANYKAHLLEWANLAEQHHVALLSIGNEMVAATKPQFTAYWNDIIDAVRSVYHGHLTYAALAPLVTNAGANEITQIGFWGKLDYAGFDVYPSLVQTNAPSVQDLTAGWHADTVFGHAQDYASFLGQMAQAVGKPVIFTETGLPSFDGASNRELTSDGNIADGSHATDWGEQADWWQAFFKTWAVDPPSWLKGVIVNNNDPAPLGAYYDQNYNINGKPAEQVIAAWFGGKTVIAPGAHALTGGAGNDQLYLFGPGAPHAANLGASLPTTVTLKLTGSILSGEAPVIHVWLNGVDEGAVALAPIDSGYVDASGVHFTTQQTFTFHLAAETPISALKIGFDSPTSVGGQHASTFFESVDVNGTALTQASYTPLGGGGPYAESMPVAGVGGNVGQWAGGVITFDASPWNAALAAQTAGGPADPITVAGLGGSDTVHVLGRLGQYAITLAADGSLHLAETSGLGQNAVLQGISFLADAAGQQVLLSGLQAGLSYHFGTGGDTIMGGSADDVISEPSGSNYLRGGDGQDSLQGGTGFDDINGNKGQDTIDGGAGGGDWLVGGQGNDLITSHASDDILYGNLGADTLNGGSGNEIIRGGQGDDVLSGGAGNDWISGDRGNDTETGGSGADVFHSFAGAGLDVVTDFHAAEGDRVMLDAGTPYSVSQVGADTVILIGGGDELVLKNVQLSTLPAGWLFGA